MNEPEAREILKAFLAQHPEQATTTQTEVEACINTLPDAGEREQLRQAITLLTRNFFLRSKIAQQSRAM